MKIALLGGSFNPPHMSHQLVCRHLLDNAGFDRVWLMPCFRHAFGKTLAAFDDRLQMCALAAKPFSGKVIVSEIEQVLAANKENRTIDTVIYIKEQYPEDQFVLIIGSDILFEFDHWKDSKKLRQIIDILVVRRQGYEEITGDWNATDKIFPVQSSTTIREKLAAGESINGLVPEEVETYLLENKLYK